MSWWIAFNAFILVLIFLDLKVFHRKAHTVSIKEALLGSAFWVGLALAFNAFIYYWKGHEPALKFLAGYVIEESLSVDNLFVFIVVFNYFRVPSSLQHRVLFWGILGALIMRAGFIMAGVTLIHHFHPVVYIFGAFLLFTAYKLVFSGEKEVRPEKNPLLKVFRKMMPVTENYEGEKFFVRHGARLFATPLMIVLLVIETTDVIFAVDSIPAVLGVSKDPFIVYTSNIFAILGLRSIFFALSGLMQMFHYLNYGLGVILAFVGIKMLIEDFYVIPITGSLGFIGVVLGVSIVISLIAAPHKKPH